MEISGKSAQYHLSHHIRKSKIMKNAPFYIIIFLNLFRIQLQTTNIETILAHFHIRKKGTTTTEILSNILKD